MQIVVLPCLFPDVRLVYFFFIARVRIKVGLKGEGWG